MIAAAAAGDEDRDGLLPEEELPEASPEALARIDRDGAGAISVGAGAGDRIVRMTEADKRGAFLFGPRTRALAERLSAAPDEDGGEQEGRGRDPART
jgi:hypothetical protein